MRGSDTFTESLFTLRKLEDFVPAAHPLRSIRLMVNAALVKMDALFSGMYEADIKGRRPSIAPEKLGRTMLLQVFYSARSERQLMEQTQYNPLCRWFSGLSKDKKFKRKIKLSMIATLRSMVEHSRKPEFRITHTRQGSHDGGGGGGTAYRLRAYVACLLRQEACARKIGVRPECH